jgi:hypothetical protein
MSFNIRKLSNIVQRSSIFLKDQNLSKIKKVYYSYIGICTIGGFTYGCKSSLDDIKSYDTFTDKFEKITLNLIVGTICGVGVGVYAPFTIPTYAIIAYKAIIKN